jgi:hypothetical protein
MGLRAEWPRAGGATAVRTGPRRTAPCPSHGSGSAAVCPRSWGASVKSVFGSSKGRVASERGQGRGSTTRARLKSSPPASKARKQASAERTRESGCGCGMGLLPRGQSYFNPSVELASVCLSSFSRMPYPPPTQASGATASVARPMPPRSGGRRTRCESGGGSCASPTRVTGAAVGAEQGRTRRGAGSVEGFDLVGVEAGPSG